LVGLLLLAIPCWGAAPEPAAPKAPAHEAPAHEAKDKWDAIGPFGGSAAIIQVDRLHQDTLLAATSNAQLFRSEDGGASWKALAFPAELRATLHAFVVNRQVPGTFLAGLSSDLAEFSGVFRTTDGGRTWKRLESPGLKEVWSIAIWPRDSRVIAAGTLDGVFLSRDGGETWKHVADPGEDEPKPVVSLQFDLLDSNTLYAGTPHLPWKTTDGGATWHSVHEGMLDDSDVFSIIGDNLHHEWMFAGSCSGIYRSTDGGETWTKLTTAKAASSRTFQIVQHPLRSNILLAATALGLVKSVDGGASWRALSSQATRSIAFDARQPDRIFVATDDDGLFRSDNLGETLQPINRGFSNRRMASLAVSGNTLYTAFSDSTGGSILRLANAGKTWETVPATQLAAGDPIKITSVDGEYLYMLTSHGLTVSRDAGHNWTAIPPPSSGSPVIDLLFASQDGRTLLVKTESGIFRTDNKGQTWNRTRFQNMPAQIFGMERTQDNGLLAATSRGLMKSDDKGTTWTPVPGALGASTVKAICTHPTQPGLFFASQYGAIFKSQDDGRSWAPIREGEPYGDAVSSLLVVPGSPDKLLVVTESRGIYALELASKTSSRLQVLR
jgi:photosystem II stability/assembly factor-like uncharacterized protein